MGWQKQKGDYNIIPDLYIHTVFGRCGQKYIRSLLLLSAKYDAFIRHQYSTPSRHNILCTYILSAKYLGDIPYSLVLTASRGVAWQSWALFVPRLASKQWHDEVISFTDGGCDR